MNILKTYIKKNKISQRKFAYLFSDYLATKNIKSGITAQTIYHWTSGKLIPRTEHIVLLAEFFGVRPESIWGNFYRNLKK